ncbi:methyltransferase domain-containing protein [Paenibacillus glucanolyticus]|nr:methyltransferase domain-containing protein [Paenibacillus glucanolyticus]ETT38928.1 hypothetical protein C169_10817 [Paenibacillus sp. FSL R5-808]MPY20124.1 glycosyltransferase [Paenibacillus glucanolyticus]
MEFTGERFIGNSNLGIEMEMEHYHRYLNVEPLIKDKVVLDAACGVGYGSALMARKAKFVYGIDLSEEAINYANEQYSTNNIEFFKSTVENINLPDKSVDVIVSFETIEHIDEVNQNKFLTEVKRILKDSGTLIISTPNKKVYSDIRNYRNEFHIREFYKEEFYSFLNNYFSYVKTYDQGFHLASTITDFLNPIELIKFESEQLESRYLIAVCSDLQDRVQISMNTVKLNLQNYYVQNDIELYSFINKLSFPHQYLYINSGEGFSEEEKIKPSFFEFSENSFKAGYELPSTKKNELRWDPLEGKIKRVQLLSVKYRTNEKNENLMSIDALESNGLLSGLNTFTFYTTDPFFLIREIPEGIQYIEFEGMFLDVLETEIDNFLNHLSIDNFKLKNDLEIAFKIRDQQKDKIDFLKENIITLNECISQQEYKIIELEEYITKNEDYIKILGNNFEDLKKQHELLHQKNSALQNKNISIEAHNNHLLSHIGSINNFNEELHVQLEEIMNSKSWKITSPLRKGKQTLKSIIKRVVRSIYLLVPNAYKQKAKNFVYSNLRFIIGNTQMYKVWESSGNITKEVNHQEIDLKDKDDVTQFVNQIYDIPKQALTEYVPFNHTKYDFQEDDIKLLAFYLPQFHPIKENDEWWGKGFTEWTNVSKAVPQFVGHYQPHLPGELGYYDLRLIDVMERQVELAKHYGIFGFCFYHYWFSGKRLLERPVDQLLENKHIDMPFCLCWANENWSRRWDGEESDILMEQKYTKEDNLAFIEDLLIYLRDDRYIKINGKPLILVYRPALFPDFKETSKVWRDYCISVGIGEIYIMGVSWGIKHPTQFDLDGLVEFPPHSIHEYGSELINERYNILNPEYNGLIFDYKKFVEEEKYLLEVDYELYKGVCPSWDNTARKPNNSTIYHNSSPDLYKRWLKKVIQHTRSTFKDDKFVFINAWNEWAEGAHLEPDRKYGYAYLEATRSAMVEEKTKSEKKLIYVSHDAHFNGAQILSLNIIKSLSLDFGYEIEVIFISGGVLLEEFRKYGNVHVLSNGITVQERQDVYKQLLKRNFRSAICNTVITGEIGEELHNSGIKFISLIHELPGVIKQYSANDKAKKIALFAEKVVFPSQYVCDQFNNVVRVDENKQVISPQGLYKSNVFKDDIKSAREQLRKKIDLPTDAFIVLGVGYADKRKGIDLFSEVASFVRNDSSNIYFVWVGNHEPNFVTAISEELKRNVIFLEATNEIDIYYAGADIYLMTSREDPFPSVVMDSMNVGVPVIGFRDAGGFSDIVTEETGLLVDYLETKQMAEAVTTLIGDESSRISKGRAARLLIEKDFYFTNYIYKLLDLLGHHYNKLSVIVPNYNYANYLSERLKTIVNQTYPIYELIILDDCSTDSSKEVIEEFYTEKSIRLKKIYNEMNSGSVFKQWARGLSVVEGEYIWIAEADDLSDPLFLEEVMKGFEYDDEVVISYSQSKQIDQKGKILANDYLDYTKDIDQKKWKESYIQEGQLEIIEALSIKNTIPNVSGVVFKKFDISEIIDSLLEYKIAGDWVFYIWLLEKGKISFSDKSLNYHRRHTNSVTKSENNLIHYNEVLRVQEYINNTYAIESEVKSKVNSYQAHLRKYLEI